MSLVLDRLATAPAQPRPPVTDDVVIVAAKSAYQLYLRFGVYACQPYRTFRAADWLGFYLDKRIRPEIAHILHIEPYIEYTDAWIEKLTLRGGPYDRQLADTVRALRDSGERPAPGDPANNEIVILTPPNDDRSIVLPTSIIRTERGPWLRRQRYVSSAALRQSPATTAELARLMQP